LALASDAGGAYLEFPDGGTLDLSRLAALPAGSELTALASLDDGRWLAAGTVPADDGGRRLLLVAGDRDGARRIGAPEAGGRLARDPVLLVDGGRWAGLAWLEGDEQRGLSVYAALRHDDGWSAPEPVAGRAPGSQLALTGAVLGDGTWLLAWSAFDGRDDEIVWSRRVGEAWLPARRVAADNAVPDVTPDLVATRGDGALLAWSRYDGHDYRLVLARFAGGEWRGDREVGAAGTVMPAFAPGDRGLRLVYRAAADGAWAVDEVTAEGALVRRAEVVSARSERPLAEVEGERVRLRWPVRSLREAAEEAP
jgi:hypothetical protein